MKAVVIHQFGGNEVTGIEDMPRPSPGPNDVMIRVRAASVNPVDWKIRSGHLRIFTGGKFPRILGRECAGEVIEAGRKVKKFKTGDQVIGLPRLRSMGCFAEYACAPETTVFPKPENVSFVSRDSGNAFPHHTTSFSSKLRNLENRTHRPLYPKNTPTGLLQSARIYCTVVTQEALCPVR